MDMRFGNVFGQYLKKAFQPASFVEKNTPRSINNFYTGYGLSKKGKIAGGSIMGGIGGYSVVTTLNENNNAIELQNTDNDSIRALAATTSDMVAYQGKATSNYTFDPTGDLVFALHKLRHGG